ncbi:MAG: hypothetical protein H6741_26880 [Alphaproteobacteria bacterium]|nr:hypothetical protein [Alphaproteobacteria bacterium]MCB9796336.1 hypothetical protein [Alphaproteobacteria bacterium]
MLTAAILAFSLSTNAYAQTNDSAGGGGGASSFGIGIIAGEPTGLSLAFGLNSRNTVQSHLSWSLANDRARVSVDYLFTITEFAAPDVSATFPFYVGLGGVVGADDRRFWDEASPVLGARVPIGIAMHPNSVPIDVFAELAPVLYLLPGTDFGMEGGIGARFWF